MNILLTLNCILALLFCCSLNAHFAKKRGKDPVLWFGLGIFGLLSFAILLLLPKGRRVQEPLPPKQKVLPPRRSDSYLKRWFYVDSAHKQVGPMEFTDLTQVFKQKEIGKQSFIWGEGMESWKRLEELPELEQELSATNEISIK